MLSNEARNLLVKTYEQMPDAVKAARTAGDVRLFAVGAERFSQLLGNHYRPLFSFAALPFWSASTVKYRISDTRMPVPASVCIR